MQAQHHHQLSADQAKRILEIKTAEAAFLKVVLGDGAQAQGRPGGRELSLARTKIEEAAMWAVRGVTAAR